MFELTDQATRRVKAERWYDRDGNLVKRVRDNIFSDARLSNPVTGAFVEYDQHDIDRAILAVPGDLDTITTYSTESLVAVAPGYGAVLVNVGSVRLWTGRFAHLADRAARPRRLLRRGHLGRGLALRRTGRLIDQVRRR